MRLNAIFHMARKRVAKLRCPICKKEVKAGEADFPFCSLRCRTIDLGKWASGEYVIKSPVAASEEGIHDQTVDSGEDT